ncbi:MAG: ATP-binding protein [Deltaproteobacteria bacterium]|nr:ATP-binding protein [Deltaproteobacteria bacterium]MBW1951751.1 ATP-binding protein [Deltaproteobacteria bacterium]MBW1986853.1 ATP-binding protein [Deltaproteobacteria bacterium]MBW2134977.1 ATP-binding protein [Deltaproteobacteria bacterium]
MRSRFPLFPFSAIVGQEDLKLALLINAVNPAIGGVLIRGEKGTGKSTAVRALAALLPEMEAVAGCIYGCHPQGVDGLCEDCQRRRAQGNGLPVICKPVPVVTLPLGATEDRVLGTLDLEAAIHTGRKRFEPGLLARAHRGILYIDEVNLLEDHLVDVLLDVAACGVNIVERESVSVAHPARFILVGTMNPEEGELRPQLLDRFGICVEVKGLINPAARAAIVNNRLAFERAPEDYIAAHQQSEAELKHRLERAKALLPAVQVSEAALSLAVHLALTMGAEGHRADLVTIQAASALAALDGRTAIGVADIKRAAVFALRHRLVGNPLEDEEIDTARLAEQIEAASSSESIPPPVEKKSR